MVKIRLGLMDGSCLISDNLDVEEVHDELAKTDMTLDDFLEFMEKLFNDFDKVESLSFKIDGTMTYFNPRNVLYAQIVRDDV